MHDLPTTKWGLVFTERANRIVFENISFARPMFIGSRQSAEKGRNAFESVAHDYVQALDVGEARIGIDCRAVAPDKAEVLKVLQQSDDIVVSRSLEDGTTFTNTFAFIDLRERGVPVVILLCAGTSHLLNEHRVQPYLERVADVIAAETPCLLLTKTSERSTRHGWGQGPLRIEIDRLRKRGQPLVIADAEGVEEGGGQFTEAEALLRGIRNQHNARALIENSRRAMVKWTGTDIEMVNGHVDWAAGGAVPPGLVRLTMRTSRGLGGRLKRLYLDSPNAWPPTKEVFSGLPSSHNAVGELVDQVENIRWFLAHAGREDWPIPRLTAELANRSYSTDRLRVAHGPDATYGNTATKHRFVVSLLRNLSLYETGVHTFPVDATQTITLKNVHPLDGKPWARPEDFARIRAWMKDKAKAAARRSYHTFSGVPATVDGRTCRLRPVYRDQKQAPGSVLYRCIADDGSVAGTSLAGDEAKYRHPYLLHEWLAESIVDAVVDAGRAPLAALADDAPDPEIAKLQQTARTIRTHIQTATATRDDRYASAQERINGEFVAPEEARKKMWSEYDSLGEELKKLKRKLDTIEHDVETRIARVERRRRGLEVGMLLDVLASLRDPTDTTYRAKWLESIYDLTVTQGAVLRSGHRGRRISWSFKLRLSGNGLFGDVIVTSHREIGASSRVDDSTRKLIDELRAGIPLNEFNPATVLLRSNVQSALGITHPIPQICCTHPTLLKLHMRVLDAVHHPRGSAALRAIESDPAFGIFGDVNALVRRIRTQFYDSLFDTRRWLLQPAPAENDALAEARNGDGSVRTEPNVVALTRVVTRPSARQAERAAQWQRQGDTLQLIPCKHCGSKQLAATRLREIDGYLCLQCRRDRAGVRWPTEFDTYTDIATTPPPNPVRPEKGGPPLRRTMKPSYHALRSLRDLTATDKAAIVHAYTADANVSARAVATAYNISYVTARTVLHEAGVMRASAATRARPRRDEHRSRT